MEQSKNTRLKKIINNQWFAGLCIALISPIIFNNAGRWFYGGTGTLDNIINNRTFDILKSSIIQDKSEYYYPLVITLYIFILAGALALSVTLERTGKRFGKYLGNTIVALVFTVFFAYSTINGAAKKSFMQFKAVSVCSISTYQGFKEFQKDIYLAKSYADAQKIINSKNCLE